MTKIYNIRNWLIADRGNCTFVHKALVAQKLGFEGLII